MYYIYIYLFIYTYNGDNILYIWYNTMIIRCIKEMPPGVNHRKFPAEFIFVATLKASRNPTTGAVTSWLKLLWSSYLHWFRGSFLMERIRNGKTKVLILDSSHVLIVHILFHRCRLIPFCGVEEQSEITNHALGYLNGPAGGGSHIPWRS